MRPWIDLEFGPQHRYPRIKIGRPEVEDLIALAGSLGPMIDRGLAVSQSAVRDRFGIAEPKADDVLMRPMGQIDPAAGIDSEGLGANALIKRKRGVFKRGQPLSGVVPPRSPKRPLRANFRGVGQSRISAICWLGGWLPKPSQQWQR